MKIESVEISNFRAIQNIKIENILDMVVIAGPNGSGKSCILDAIRLIKSVYGGYQQNEVQNWFGEFQINPGNPSSFLSMFREKEKSLRVFITIKLHPEELSYLKNRKEEIIRLSVWRSLVPELGWYAFQTIAFAEQLRSKEKEINDRLSNDISIFDEEINNDSITGEITISPNGQIFVRPSKVLEIVFGTYDPPNVGVIDYHGPTRQFGRQQIGGVSLEIGVDQRQQRSQQSIYNYNAKYGNVKGELAQSYVREAIAAKAGVKIENTHELTETLQELFRLFFPDKEFLGPQPTSSGNIEFPVLVSNGGRHDIDELSSGEKEIIFGYLRLRSSAPRYSIIMIDEPELHLNPRLIRGFPEFYHRKLGLDLNNQIWLITHSDALLRESVGREGYSVFHMQSVGSKDNNFDSEENQIYPLRVIEDLDRAVIDLVGDLASYKPGAKLVIFEGDGSEFDRYMVGILFPNFENEVNSISAGNKNQVRSLHSVLESAREAGAVPFKVFSITDQDSERIGSDSITQRYVWDVYHIENYLLNSEIISRVLNDINGPYGGISMDAVEEELLLAAEGTIPDLVRHTLVNEINGKIVGAINFNFDSHKEDVSFGVARAIARTKERILKVADEEYSYEKIRIMELQRTEMLKEFLLSGSWKEKFRGRDILKRFCGKHGGGVKYEIFRNLIISKMHQLQFSPKGMKDVINKITES